MRPRARWLAQLRSAYGFAPLRQPPPSLLRKTLALNVKRITMEITYSFNNGRDTRDVARERMTVDMGGTKIGEVAYRLR